MSNIFLELVLRYEQNVGVRVANGQQYVLNISNYCIIPIFGINDSELK
ncbi:MAG: hypothetical protein LBC20_11120 [Planctomycetaceae bacterium]|nr:hypothetical protein [Planctomycetaceae bacterium]